MVMVVVALLLMVILMVVVAAEVGGFGCRGGRPRELKLGALS
jgi:hypothetical protein